MLRWLGYSSFALPDWEVGVAMPVLTYLNHLNMNSDGSTASCSETKVHFERDLKIARSD